MNNWNSIYFTNNLNSNTLFSLSFYFPFLFPNFYLTLLTLCFQVYSTHILHVPLAPFLHRLSTSAVATSSSMLHVLGIFFRKFLENIFTKSKRILYSVRIWFEYFLCVILIVLKNFERCERLNQECFFFEKFFSKKF